MSAKLYESTTQSIPIKDNASICRYKVTTHASPPSGSERPISLSKIYTPFVSPHVQLTMETTEPSAHSWIIPGNQRFVTIGTTADSDCEVILHLTITEGRSDIRFPEVPTQM